MSQAWEHLARSCRQRPTGQRGSLEEAQRALWMLVGGMVVLLSACHDSGGLSATSPLSTPMLARASDVSAVGPDWNYFSAVMSVHSEHVRGGRTVARDLVINITRTYQRDSAWHTVMEPMLNQLNAGPRNEPRAWVARIEMGPNGSRIFDGFGHEVIDNGFRAKAPSEALLAALPEAPRLPAITNAAPAALPVPGVESRYAWADRMLADRASGSRARERYAKLFRGSGTQDARGLRYSRERGETQIDLVADSITGVPIEISETRAGTQLYHVMNSYERQADGRTILRETRIERPDAMGGGSVMMRTRFDNIKISREATGL